MFRTRNAVFIGAPLSALVAFGVWLAKADSPAPPEKSYRASISPVLFLSGDKLTDFVIDSGESFSCPQSREQLDKAIESGRAMRSSDFFARRDVLPKPFFGELPTSLCARLSDQIKVRKDFNWTTVQIKSPKQPEIFIVSAGSADNAMRAMYEGEGPVSYGKYPYNEPYWAVIYAGSSSSTPTSFLIDRVKLTRESAEVRFYCPLYGMVTMDIVPYWFCIPLGRLPEGPYSVSVRDANHDKVIATTKVSLRNTTEDEVANRNAAARSDQELSSQHFRAEQDKDHEEGAALQVRLERVAEYIHSAELAPEAKKALTSDVEKLAKAVRWDYLLRYGGGGQKLAAPTPGKIPGLEVGRNSFDKDPEWQPSNIPLSDIWLCDGADAGWYASATYRNVPAFNGALTAENPTPIQQKIAKIWAALQEKGKDPHGMMYSAFPAAGTIDDAIDTAYDVLVDGKTPIKKFSSNDEMWALLIARRSFLIRQVSTRSVEHEVDLAKRTEFFVHASAYIGQADDVKEPAPVTFALIPLGQSKDVQSVGISYGCQSICGKPLTNGAEPLYASPPEELLGDYARGLSIGTGFEVTP